MYISTEMLNEDNRGHNDESKRARESKKAEEQERERERNKATPRLKNTFFIFIIDDMQHKLAPYVYITYIYICSIIFCIWYARSLVSDVFSVSALGRWSLVLVFFFLLHPKASMFRFNAIENILLVFVLKVFFVYYIWFVCVVIWKLNSTAMLACIWNLCCI